MELRSGEAVDDFYIKIGLTLSPLNVFITNKLAMLNKCMLNEQKMLDLQDKMALVV